MSSDFTGIIDEFIITSQKVMRSRNHDECCFWSDVERRNCIRIWKISILD